MSEDLNARRQELQELNEQAWRGHSVFATKKLDSSLKKNTAYIKKIRTSVGLDSKKFLIDQLATTSLEKYLNELLPATFEGLSKITKNQDLAPAVEVVSALHQRFHVEFTPYLMLSFLYALASPSTPTADVPEKEEKERIVRQRNLLKLFMELHLAGVFRNIDDMPKSELPPYLLKKVNKGIIEPIVVAVLKEVLSFEYAQDSHSYSSSINFG
ncbi:unnamed protein product [Ambrosiozyma monospora]|uniref:Unnamed protein product n=1 Tax=Ambrosiozyma monospora TaxID=43982 RepID=A0ACB5TSG5_AMBMO|nr:unnamed protein product [Ambrosiozyma monospora]